MRVNLKSPSRSAVQRAAEVTREGGVVLSPTDTIYGLSCDPFQDGAIEKLLQIKDRPARKGLLLLVPEIDWVRKLSVSIPLAFNLLTEPFWPGPLTILLQGVETLSPLIRGEEGKVGFRIPDCPFLRQWMEAVEGPLVSTSANPSGEAPSSSMDRLKELYEAKVDLFLEDPDRTLGGAPSTVVDLATEAGRIVRRGARADEIEAVLY